MKSIYKYILGLLVIGVLAMPFVVKNEVNKHIDSAKQSLNTNGVELTIVSEKGYISSTREIELKVTNGQLFSDYILTKLTQDNPSYKTWLRLIKESTKYEIRAILDGLTFKGTIKNSNLFLSKPEIELSLVKLSDKNMSFLKKNKKASDVIFPMLAEKMITFYVTLDSNQNISQIIMKNIDKNIKNHGKNINFQLVDNKLKLDVAENLVGNYSLGKQSIKSDDFSILTSGLSYKFEYLNKFNKSDTLHIDSFETKNDEFTLKIGNVDLGGSIADGDKKTLNIDTTCDIQDINFNGNGELKLKKFTYTVNLSGLDKDGVVKASSAYNKQTFKSTRVTQADTKETVDAVQKILNTGFKLNAKTLLNSFSFMGVHLDKVDFLLNAELKENKYTINDREIIKGLLLNGSLTMNKESLKQLVSKNRSLEKFLKLAKKDGDKRIFNYNLKNGKIFINGTKL